MSAFAGVGAAVGFAGDPLGASAILIPAKKRHIKRTVPIIHNRLIFICIPLLVKPLSGSRLTYFLFLYSYQVDEIYPNLYYFTIKKSI
jgi:hypothetical protein